MILGSLLLCLGGIVVISLTTHRWRTFVPPYMPVDLTKHGNYLEKSTFSLQEKMQLSLNVSKTRGNYLVYTSMCKIRDMDPYDASIKDVINDGTALFKCNKFHSFTYQKQFSVHVNWTAVNASNYKKTFRNCDVRPVHRPVGPKTNKYSREYLTESRKFTDWISVDQEYINVKCFDDKNKIIYENFHSFVIRKADVEARCKRLFQRRKALSIEDSFNVMIIGLDSVSRLNSMRFLKKTRKFLIENMSATEMLGYNKVGDNTFPNMVPFLTGRYVDELPWNESDPVVFDNFTFAWNLYSDNGYRTLFLEDQPHGAIFDYLKPGFHQTPTDYYNRHVQLAMYDKTKYWYEDKNCFVDTSQTERILNYTYRFMSTFQKDPYFGFIFITRLTHDVLEQTAAADDIYHHFLKSAFENGLWNNTILFFMSDHGIRFGKIRSYFIGKMEERLPLMFISLPERFKHKYSKLSQNLKLNSGKLTTPFDIYETLNDVLYFKSEYKDKVKNWTKRAYSLFRTIPENRSCEDATIEEHWCTCSQLQEISKKHRNVKNSAKYFLSKINEMLIPVRNMCAILRIKNIESAYKFVSGNKDLQKAQWTLQLTVQVEPGNGIFEGTILYDTRQHKHKLGGEISRINSYGKEKRCSVDYKLEKLCYCKSNLNVMSRED